MRREKLERVSDSEGAGETVRRCRTRAASEMERWKERVAGRGGSNAWKSDDQVNS